MVVFQIVVMRREEPRLVKSGRNVGRNIFDPSTGRRRIIMMMILIPRTYVRAPAVLFYIHVGSKLSRVSRNETNKAAKTIENEEISDLGTGEYE